MGDSQEEAARKSRKREHAVLADAYLPLDELATYAGLSVRTLTEYLHHPRHPLAHYQIGKKILVRRSTYDTWIDHFRIEDTPRDISGHLDAMVRGD